jgi:hypothetical protein
LSSWQASLLPELVEVTAVQALGERDQLLGPGSPEAVGPGPAETRPEPLEVLDRSLDPYLVPPVERLEPLDELVRAFDLPIS